MSKCTAIVALLIVIGCGGGEEKSPGRPQLSRTPVSVRGWIADIERTEDPTMFKTVDTEVARRSEVFANTNMWIEGMPFVSGGIAETGAFVLLDVPPGDVTISFATVGAENAQLVLKNIPGNSDVMIPGLLLTKTGSKLTQPENVKIRIAGSVTRPTGKTGSVNGVSIPVVEVPLKTMMDRRDYPEVASMAPAPVAKVK
jgi:hypothetical protein